MSTTRIRSAIRKAMEPVDNPEARLIFKRPPGRYAPLSDGAEHPGNNAVWWVSVNGLPIGTASSMNTATDLLYEKGYKVWAYRRVENEGDHPEYRANLVPIKADKV